MINILPNSYIQRHYIITEYEDPIRKGIYNEYYTRKDDFDSRLLFTSTHSKLYYMLVNEDKKIILTGKLSGHYNDIDYDYRFDFDKYIVFNYEFTDRQKSVVYNEINIFHLELVHHCHRLQPNHQYIYHLTYYYFSYSKN